VSLGCRDWFESLMLRLTCIRGMQVDDAHLLPQRERSRYTVMM
jgi:hypothetical protein